jgi:hypothetical protein
MEQYFGALTLTLLLAMVLIRVRLMRRKGIQAVHFGNIDKSGFPDSAVRPILLSHRVRCRIQLAHGSQAPLL